MYILQNNIFFWNMFWNLHFSGILKYLKRTALQQIYGILSCFREVHGKLNVYRIFVFLLDELHNCLYLLH